MILRQKKIFVLFFLMITLNLNSVNGQESVPLTNGGVKKPVMYSVFWNTLWGSAWGATMGFSYHLVSGIKLRESIITSTTIGGLLGYGLGIYLVVNGLSFDESYLLELPSPKFKTMENTTTYFKEEMIPIYSNSENYNSNIWELPIFELKF